MQLNILLQEPAEGSVECSNAHEKLFKFLTSIGFVESGKDCYRNRFMYETKAIKLSGNINDIDYDRLV